MRVNSDIVNFYWSHAIALQKLSNERSYKFSSILTLTEVISIRNSRLKQWRPLNSAYAAEPKRHIKKLFATDDDDKRRRKLRSNTHGCELTSKNILNKLFGYSFQTHTDLERSLCASIQLSLDSF